MAYIKKLYVAYNKDDRLQLPVGVYTSITEAERILGICNSGAIYVAIHRDDAVIVNGKKYKFDVVIDIEDDDFSDLKEVSELDI